MKLKYSTTFHSQTDQQIERQNSILKQYLRSVMNYQQNNMAHTSSGGTQACDKPANTSLSTEIKNYLLKMKSIENTKTLSLLKHTKQTMRTLKTHVVMKNKNVDAFQIMNKMTEIMQKISQKMDNLKKKNSNTTKKNFVETTRDFNAHASTFTSQKTNKLKQMLNIKMMMIYINSDVDEKIFIKKLTHDFINRITVNCQNIIKIIKLQNHEIISNEKTFKKKHDVNHEHL